MNEYKIPIIVGVADVLDRTRNLDEARETAVLIKEALTLASKDTGVENVLNKIEYIDIVNVASYPYGNLEETLSRLLPENSNRKIVHGPVGGESPIRYINRIAQDIAKGELQIAAVCGGEAQRATMQAFKEKKIPNGWTAPDMKKLKVDPLQWITPYALKYGLIHPTDVYPLYENNLYGHYGQTFQEASQESASLWHNMSKVATTNPYAWISEEKATSSILTVDENNRMIAFPYTKFLVANNSVNSSSALIITSVGTAKEMGIAEEKWIYVGAGAAANEPKDFLQRDNYHHSSSIEAVLNKTLEFNGIKTEDLDHIELYSCFPCIPKMARRILGLTENNAITVSGGLTFAGAALNNYMTASATQMVRKLRENGKKGLLFGNGEYVTKNHAILLSKEPVDEKIVLTDYSVQDYADSLRGTIPPLLEHYEGAAKLETYTVIYDKNGPKNAVVIGLSPDGKRFASKVPLWNTEDIKKLIQPTQSLTGTAGIVVQNDGMNEWHFSDASIGRDPEKQRVFISAQDAPVTFEKYGKHIAIVTLNRPEKRNAVNGEVTKLMYDYIQQTENDTDIRVVILTSSNDKVFCAGADLSEVAKGNASLLVHPKGGFGGYVSAVRTKPWIAAVNGFALGGGLEFSLAADIVICGEGTSFGLPEVKRGIFAAAGGVFRLPRVIPHKIALEMITTGEPIDAQRAMQLGLVNRLVEASNVQEDALKLASKIAENAPLAVQYSLEIARKAIDMSEEELWRLNEKRITKVMQSHDAQEGSSSFVEKRKPNWKGN